MLIPRLILKLLHPFAQFHDIEVHELIFSCPFGPGSSLTPLEISSSPATTQETGKGSLNDLTWAQFVLGSVHESAVLISRSNYLSN